MKATAIINLVLLSLWSAFRAVEMCYICICGNCGWLIDPWVLFHVVVIMLCVGSIVCMRKRNQRALSFAFGFGWAVLALQLWGTLGYVLAIFAGTDWFDLLLFIPLALSLVNVGCVWRLKHVLSQRPSLPPTQ